MIDNICPAPVQAFFFYIGYICREASLTNIRPKVYILDGTWTCQREEEHFKFNGLWFIISFFLRLDDMKNALISTTTAKHTLSKLCCIWVKRQNKFGQRNHHLIYLINTFRHGGDRIFPSHT